MKNKILVYDDNCPLCTWYSGLFIKYGLLNPDGIRSFSTLDSDLLSRIDFDKSRNEIPLLDIADNKVIYGIDALLEILDQKIPCIKTIANLAPLKWLLTRLYKLVSYNRKVIVAEKCSAGLIDCSPDMNYRYRFLFMALSLAFNTLLVFPLHDHVFNKLSYYHLTIREMQFAHFVFVFMNCMLAFTFSKERGYEYLGQVNMLALSVILLLTPLMILHTIFFTEIFSTGWLILCAAFIFKEYMRRMEYAGILQRNKWVVSMNLLCLTGFILFLFH